MHLTAQDNMAEELIDQLAKAVVATKDLDYGLSRVWEAYTKSPGITTMVLRALNTAAKLILKMQE